jgi:hypothetical protein
MLNADSPPEIRVFVVDVSAISAASLSFGDLIDLADATDIEPEDMDRTLNGKARGRDRLRLIVGFAWIVSRRAEPELTYTDVLRGRVEVVGKLDPTKPPAGGDGRDESPRS